VGAAVVHAKELTVGKVIEHEQPHRCKFTLPRPTTAPSPPPPPPRPSPPPPPPPKKPKKKKKKKKRCEQ